MHCIQIRELSRVVTGSNRGESNLRSPITRGTTTIASVVAVKPPHRPRRARSRPGSLLHPYK